ncbi:POB3, partial [Symbiodinium sp. CCMP2592]
MVEEITFQNVRCVGQAGRGAFRLDERQLGWKRVSGQGQDSQKQPMQWAGSGLTQAEWSATAGGGHGILKLHFGADIVRFADLEPSSFQKLKEHLKECFKVQLEEQKPSSVGWSWGELELNGEKSLRLMSGLDNDRAVALEVDMAEVNQVACAGKNELSLELQNRPDE